MKKKILSVVSAVYVKEYKIKLTFQDETERVVNFQKFLEKSTNPHIKEYLDLKKFKIFNVQNEQLIWGDFDLIFPIDDLYSGKISA